MCPIGHNKPIKLGSSCYFIPTPFCEMILKLWDYFCVFERIMYTRAE